MARFLSSNDCILDNSDDIHQKLSTPTNFRCAFIPWCQNVKILKIDL